jgi:hypothetical protein
MRKHMILPIHVYQQEQNGQERFNLEVENNINHKCIRFEAWQKKESRIKASLWNNLIYNSIFWKYVTT